VLLLQLLILVIQTPPITEIGFRSVLIIPVIVCFTSFMGHVRTNLRQAGLTLPNQRPDR
jgi:hypothetical protein